MIEAVCIQKFRDKHNKITGYRIQDASGYIDYISADDLKTAIKNNKIHILNLKLTQDNRLIENHKADSNIEDTLLKIIRTLFKAYGFREYEIKLLFDNSQENCIDKKYTLKNNDLCYDNQSIMISTTYYIESKDLWLTIETLECESLYEYKFKSLDRRDILTGLREFIDSTKNKIAR